MPGNASTLIHSERIFIGGDWREPESGRMFPTYNPATGEVLAEVGEAGEAEVDQAVRACRFCPSRASKRLSSLLIVRSTGWRLPYGRGASPRHTGSLTR